MVRSTLQPATYLVHTSTVQSVHREQNSERDGNGAVTGRSPLREFAGESVQGLPAPVAVTVNHGMRVPIWKSELNPAIDVPSYYKSRTAATLLVADEIGRPLNPTDIECGVLLYPLTSLPAGSEQPGSIHDWKTVECSVVPLPQGGVAPLFVTTKQYKPKRRK